jgi:hypothetical protein
MGGYMSVIYEGNNGLVNGRNSHIKRRNEMTINWNANDNVDVKPIVDH